MYKYWGAVRQVAASVVTCAMVLILFHFYLFINHLFIYLLLIGFFNLSDENMEHVAMYQDEASQYYQDAMDNMKKMNDNMQTAY